MPDENSPESLKWKSSELVSHLEQILEYPWSGIYITNS